MPMTMILQSISCLIPLPPVIRYTIPCNNNIVMELIVRKVPIKANIFCRIFISHILSCLQIYYLTFISHKKFS